MKGLDYRWLEALDAVIAHGGFDKGAEALFITQSAVSQRIKQLEKWLAQPALVRESPPQPTAIGKKLLGSIAGYNCWKRSCCRSSLLKGFPMRCRCRLPPTLTAWRPGCFLP